MGKQNGMPNSPPEQSPPSLEHSGLSHSRSHSPSPSQEDGQPHCGGLGGGLAGGGGLGGKLGRGGGLGGRGGLGGKLGGAGGLGCGNSHESGKPRMPEKRIFPLSQSVRGDCAMTPSGLTFCCRARPIAFHPAVLIPLPVLVGT